MANIDTEPQQEEQQVEEAVEETAQTAEETVTEEAAKIADLEAQLAAEKEKLLRTAAEYANFRSRTEREKAAIYANAVSDTVSELLPIADSVDRAIQLSANAPEEFKKGLEMISNQLAKSFEKLNITAFGEVGEEFNPELHNAISSVDSDELESDTIALVYQKGYKVGDKIIRHCMVQTVN
ncbi:MAG: nucleotide exchange factor GrpE [Clostridia bacterium]|nr:nucleotide exchange factor GrpE [Clostridia bacterium]